MVDELMIININQIKDIKFNKIIMSYQVVKPGGAAMGDFLTLGDLISQTPCAKEP